MVVWPVDPGNGVNSPGRGKEGKMLYNLYTIYDRTAQQAGPVFCAINDGIAVRSARHTLSDVAWYDLDAYGLYKVGTFDTEKMTIDALESPDQIIIPSMPREKPANA